MPNRQTSAVKNGLPLKSVLFVCSVAYSLASPQEVVDGNTRVVLLAVPAGVPLRLYLTKHVSKRAGAPVEAKLLTSIYAFDNEVILSGTRVFGRVSRLQPVPKWQRFRAVMGGDFTPLHIAQVEFTSFQTTDGRRLEIRTLESSGLRTIVPLRPPKQRGQSGQVKNGGVLGAGKQKAQDAIDTQIERIKSIPSIVRGPGKQEWLLDFLMAKLPYHPQFVHNRTRFDAELLSPLDFGSKAVSQNSLSLLGSQPAPGSTVHARLLTSLDSSISKQGDSVQAVLEEPLFSADRKLIFPEGTLVQGAVTMAKHARWFHRGGHLRFNFQSVDLTPQTAALMAAPVGETSSLPSPRKLQFRTMATLHAAEGGNEPLKVDKEGGVNATESKTRFIGTVIALLISRRAADLDHDHPRVGGGSGQGPNLGARTLGGGLGFGLLGSIAARSSPNVGAVLGYYGMAWTVFTTVFARGADVQFGKNAVIDIGFNQRAADVK